MNLQFLLYGCENLVSHTKGRRQIENVRVHGAEEKTWT